MTEVLYGNDIIQRRVLEAYSRIKNEIAGCMDHTEIAMHVTYETIWNFHLQLKRKGVRLKAVTEITPDNISYAKKLTELFEIRHLTGVRSNFAVVDRKRVSTSFNFA